MRILDLFAGIGGFSLAAHWMGWTTEAFVERDKFCQKVLRKNFGQEIEIHDDIFTFSGEPFRGRVDVVTGGFPCQPFSAAGKRKGRADERHLFPEMLRVIREVKPRWVVAENVRGLLSIESGAVFAEVVTSLEGEGYEVITFCVPASAVGAPHRRDRLWIVAHAKRDGLPASEGIWGPTAAIREQSAGPDNALDPEGADRVLDATDARHSDESECGAIARDDAKEHGLSEVPGRVEYGAAVSGGADRDDPDADGKRCIGRGEQSKDRGRSVQEGCGNNRALSESAISRREPAVTDSPGLQGCGCGSEQQAILAENGAQLRHSDASHTGDTGLQGGEFTGAPGEGTRASRSASECLGNGWGENWIEVAARLCRVDDGLPAGLDVVGARDNRVSRLRALGNSVVPIIPFEIFKAIDAAN